MDMDIRRQFLPERNEARVQHTNNEVELFLMQGHVVGPSKGGERASTCRTQLGSGGKKLYQQLRGRHL
ncbi:hypothetical protein SS50377_27064 [Spironucleus salmonicida]|uniref:Uncharacterized protein n=1 Tax=Spironucleus salmonicida TaxID=348837 RepID=A0A9P8LM97_9EUKA|nr:hypothetical protein SS50377_27056 [Spironucleus salmonicida]KAH0570776.1 hypothetical protein SS50377_27064 [Spironucleus salmonicida]